MKCLSKVLFTALSVATLGGTAIAQEPPAGEEGGVEAGAEAGATVEGEAAMPPPEPPPATTEEPMAAMDPLTLGAGKIMIAGSTLNINLSADAVGEPISLAPSVYYGVNDKLTVGITHDGGTTPWSPRPALRFITIDTGLGDTVRVAGAGGICLTGEDSGCPDVYDNIGLDALFGLGSGQFSYAAHGGIDVASFGDSDADIGALLQLRVGVLGRYAVNEKISVVFDPRISIGLTERDFNKETLDIPVWLWFQANPQLAAHIHTGIAGALDGFGDTYTVPVQVGASYKVNEQLTAGLDFSFLNLLGEGGDADFRMLALRAAYRL